MLRTLRNGSLKGEGPQHFAPLQVFIDQATLQPTPSGQTALRPSAALTNIACAFCSLWLPDTAPVDRQLFSLDLIPAREFAEAQAGPAPSNEKLSEKVLAGCDASQCNAELGAWLRVDDLQPEEEYLVVQRPGSLNAQQRYAGNASAQHVMVLLQGLTAGGLPLV